jgi:GntR family transcriptional regulator/MocR family aminotransferase
MPVTRRYELLDWAGKNDSFVIEDDYDSELRYFGMPVPALQGLEGGKRVVYIGSFTSTLFPAVRISYMVLPHDMISIYETMKMDYDQTCSKTEQLTLALFMQRGFYGANLRKIRNLYSHKLREAMDAIGEYGGKDGFASAENTRSGINIILRIDTGAEGGDEKEAAGRLIDDAAGLGIKVRSIPQLSHDGLIYLIFYYNQIPAGEIKASVQKMLSAFRETVRGN